ncbi:uncharacterized protein LOC120068802 [Benincasa hispida]|uniref:uncharacterized protein LOC120068802 n=1 Tax=Benincasa hispida TaxID=102211 RepID=UPI00190299EB|nr:uncharacterized protein LOC120068802 [Benincasa hispida]
MRMFVELKTLTKTLEVFQSNPKMSKISSTFLPYFIQKRFLSTVSSSTLPLPSVSTIEFLKNSCGLAYRQFGLEATSILQSRVSNNLKPKFEFLEEIGIVGPLLPKVILLNPTILLRSLDSQLKPSFCFTKGMLESDEQVTVAIRRSSWLLTSDFKGIMQSNINVLVNEGVPSRNIAKLIALQPRAIMQKVDRGIYVVKTEELGTEPKARMFIYAVRVMVSMNESTWMKKINVLKSLGWSEKEIFTAFKRDPLCLACSDEKMRDVADFCFNTAMLDPGTVISYPKFFMCGLNKRRTIYQIEGEK